MQKKSFNTPDEMRTPPLTRVDVIKIGGKTLLRNRFEPGWKWSKHVKPSADTGSCQVHHVLYVMSGHLKVVMDNGDELEIGPEDVADIPPGHDAWVVGDEAMVGVDVGGGDSYARVG